MLQYRCCRRAWSISWALLLRLLLHLLLRLLLHLLLLRHVWTCRSSGSVHVRCGWQFAVQACGWCWCWCCRARKWQRCIVQQR
jgi:hypothetical protein